MFIFLSAKMYDLIKYMDEYYEEKNRIAPFQPKFPEVYRDNR